MVLLSLKYLRSLIPVLIFFVATEGTQLYSQMQCLRGRIVDDQRGLALADVHVSLLSKAAGTLSDSLGLFELCGIKQGDIIELHHIAYYAQTIVVSAAMPDYPEFRMKLRTVEGAEVTVRGRSGLSVSALPGQATISSADIVRMPSFMGEADVIKTMQTMPGVQSVSEGVGEVFVRGGAPGQNMILIDGMELMNPLHLMGLYSVFNPHTTQKADIYKGHAPASLSERISSVIMVSSNDPLRGETGISASLGTLTSGLALTRRSKNGKWGITGGLRRSFVELYRFMSMQLIPDEDNYFAQSSYSFYDFNGRAVYQPFSNGLLSFNWYLSADRFSLGEDDINDEMSTHFGNRAASLVWKHNINSWLSYSLSSAYTGSYSYFEGDLSDSYIDFDNEHRRFSLNGEISIQKARNTVTLGVKRFSYRTVPQDMSFVVAEDTVLHYNEFKNTQFDVYLEDNLRLSDKLQLTAAARMHNYKTKGPLRFSAKEGTLFSPEEWNKNRDIYDFSASLALKWEPKPSYHFKLAASRQVQTVHLASISSLPLPNDIWMMSTPFLKPQTGRQISAGYYNNGVLFSYSGELFAKSMDKQAIFAVNTGDSEMELFEEHFFIGNGRIYGAELSGKKHHGRFTGELSYTLMRSERSFPAIDEGRWYPDKFDRTHDLSLSLFYKINERWEASSYFVYASGANLNLPSGRMWLMGTVMNDYNGFNGYRLPPYHRLDFSLNYHLKSAIFKESVLSFSVMNVYNRANPYFAFFSVKQGSGNYNINISAYQVSLFPVLPSVGWRFKF